MRLRDKIARLRPLCPDCAAEGVTRAGEELDHELPLHRGGTDDDENLSLRCTDHHRRKTARERGYRLRGCGEDGEPVDPQKGW